MLPNDINTIKPLMYYVLLLPAVGIQRKGKHLPNTTWIKIHILMYFIILVKNIAYLIVFTFLMWHRNVLNHALLLSHRITLCVRYWSNLSWPCDVIDGWAVVENIVTYEIATLVQLENFVVTIYSFSINNTLEDCPPVIETPRSRY